MLKAKLENKLLKMFLLTGYPPRTQLKKDNQTRQPHTTQTSLHESET